VFVWLVLRRTNASASLDGGNHEVLTIERAGHEDHPHVMHDEHREKLFYGVHVQH